MSSGEQTQQVGLSNLIGRDPRVIAAIEASDIQSEPNADAMFGEMILAAETPEAVAAAFRLRLQQNLMLGVNLMTRPLAMQLPLVVEEG